MKKAFLLSVLYTSVSLISSGQNKSDNKDFLTWATTPPMGWNSWDCYGPTVTESEVKANADYMAEKLKKFGWEYIVVDIRWFVENDKAHGYNEKDPIYVMDEYGRFLPSTLRFPSASNGKGFKPLADYVHSKGLKLGIHIMRGIPVEAVKKNTPILGSKATAGDIYSTEGQCPWLKDMYTIIAGKDGAQEYYNSIFKLYASWGVDFIKIDDLSIPYHTEEIEMIRKAIDNCGRKIVLSTSPGETPVKNADHIKSNANMWRIVGDFWDNWPQLKEHFDVCNRWSPYIGNGHFPDADMLPLGRIGIRAERGDDRMCQLSKDEQITLMSLFAIFRSPLMFGGDLPSNDSFTLSLLTNKDVLSVNKYSQNNKQLFRRDDLIAWVADDPKTGDIFLAVFNAQDSSGLMLADSAAIPVALEQLGIEGYCTIKDLWNEKNIGTFSEEFAPVIPRHGSGLYRISRKK
jgi:alpha-galactosidase